MAATCGIPATLPTKKTKVRCDLWQDQRFQAVFCVGEFSSEEMDLEENLG